jgi:glycosyltransferase involved in cell wall biosynthesis
VREPAVSIILPTYQRRDLVRRSIASALRQSYRDFELIVVDDGSTDGTREALERLAGELRLDVRFAGAVGQDELAAFYEDAEVFCLPTFAEGLGVVLLEAMAAGLPVVSSLVMGVPEVVEDGETGLLVLPGRADLLAEALARLAESEELRERLGSAGRRWVED